MTRRRLDLVEHGAGVIGAADRGAAVLVEQRHIILSAVVRDRRKAIQVGPAGAIIRATSVEAILKNRLKGGTRG